MQSDTVRFNAAVQAICREAREMGLAVPGFLSPPGLTGTDRTICRRHGKIFVAVRVRGRPFTDVVADVIEGVLVANGVPRGPDMRARRRLIAAVEPVVRRMAA